MIDFDTFIKIALECERFGEINCCQRLQKLTQSPINCPIWSHWRHPQKTAFIVNEPTVPHIPIHLVTHLGTHYLVAIATINQIK